MGVSYLQLNHWLSNRWAFFSPLHCTWPARCGWICPVWPSHSDCPGIAGPRTLRLVNWFPSSRSWSWTWLLSSHSVYAPASADWIVEVQGHAPASQHLKSKWYISYKQETQNSDNGNHLIQSHITLIWSDTCTIIIYCGIIRNYDGQIT